jgi:hypothetical protein
MLMPRWASRTVCTEERATFFPTVLYAWLCTPRPSQACDAVISIWPLTDYLQLDTRMAPLALALTAPLQYLASAGKSASAY